MKQAMTDVQEFCLRWNNHQSNLVSAFHDLRLGEDFVDVTLACDGRSLQAHKVVLSACSPFFRDLLKVSSIASISVSILYYPNWLFHRFTSSLDTDNAMQASSNSFEGHIIPGSCCPDRVHVPGWGPCWPWWTTVFPEDCWSSSSQRSDRRSFKTEYFTIGFLRTSTHNK